jgi:hypothetical protein
MSLLIILYLNKYAEERNLKNIIYEYKQTSMHVVRDVHACITNK